MGRPECLQWLRLQDLQVRAGQCEYDFEQRHPQHRRGGEGHPLGRHRLRDQPHRRGKRPHRTLLPRLRGQRSHGRAGILGRGRGRRHNFLRRHGVGHRLLRQGAGPAFGTQCPAVQLFGDTCRLLRRAEYPAAAYRAGGAGSDSLRAVGDGEHGGEGKGRALPRRRGQVGVRQPDGALPGYGRCGNLPLRTPRRGAGGGGQIPPPRPGRYALSPNTATITC